ncbi:MAG: hypothetical protein K1X72_05315 [Pyrinomonadaceae bacterium]|nr:hypothetical protein [Pyrinomonadaceae bacterium]
MKKILITLLQITFLASFAVANPFITWFPQEFECPIDKEKNTFMVWGSYGSYIYSYPSKYQWLFFPWTSANSYYICKKCHLATFLGDFDRLPKEKLPAIKKVLEDIKVSKTFKDYNELSVSERMEVMEKVYAVLEKDESWWENFYRLKGYHNGKEGNKAKATEARKKSLELIQKDFADEKSETPKKLALYISGAMKHFLDDDKGALEDLQKALETKYQEKDAKPEDLKNAEEGLNERIKEYMEKIKSEKNKPRLFDSTNDDDH